MTLKGLDSFHYEVYKKKDNWKHFWFFSNESLKERFKCPDICSVDSEIEQSACIHVSLVFQLFSVLLAFLLNSSSFLCFFPYFYQLCP